MLMYDNRFHGIQSSLPGSFSHHLACIDAWALVNMSQTFTQAPFTNLVAWMTRREMNYPALPY